MKFFAKLILCCFYCIATPSSAQIMDQVGTRVIQDAYTQYAAILYNGEILVKENTPDGPLMVDSNLGGSFTVSKVDRHFDQKEIKENIGFKVAILNNRTRALRMFSEETFYEITIDQLIGAYEIGDKIIFITIDPLHQLPRHEVMFSIGC